jgi:hypothetical protein
MGSCNTSTNCNPCGPDFNAINQLATRAGAYARQANTYAVDAENSWLEFNALYLGAFAVAPSVDNEGNPLQEGALYWNSVSNELFAWNGSTWVATNFNEFTPFLATGTTTPRNLVTREADVVNVKDFGAVGDGVADDTAAIQAAVNTQQNVYFPSGKYLTTSTITISTRGQKFFGDTNIDASTEATIAGTIPTGSVILCNSVNSTSFLVTLSQVQFCGISFYGYNKNNNNKCIVFQMNVPYGTENFDGYMDGCLFQEFNICVECFGRAITATNNLFVGSNTGIILDWPSSGASTSPPSPSSFVPPLGNRSCRITSNRFHNISTQGILSQNTSGDPLAYLRSALISENMMDVGNGALFKATGGIYGTVFNNNTRGFGNISPFIFDGGEIENVLFTSNYFGGVKNNAAASPFSGIQFIDCNTIKNVSITGNSFADTDGYCVIFQGVGTTISNIIFSNNICSNIGQDGLSTRAIISTEFDIDGFVFSGNIAKEDSPPTIIRFTSSLLTLSNARIFNNIVDTTKLFISTISYGSNISIENGNGNFGLNTSPSTILTLQGSTSLPIVATRSGSTSGVGTRYINSAGSIDILSTPTGGNAGTFTPGSDDLVSLGSGAFRWSQLFAGTNVINTSDEREKQQIRSLSEAEKNVAIKLKSLIKAFKFNNAVEAKGEDARIHVGVIAQEVVSAFESEELDATRYGLLCYDEWDEQPEEKDSEGNVIQEYRPSGNRYGIRYDQLLAFIIAAQ